jgi:RimJ/RimL family protein N-acetyltransferase
MITLSPIKSIDIHDIAKWSPYEGIHSQMNYAINEDGWLNTYCCNPQNFCFVAKNGNLCVGFSLLIYKDSKEAEFRIAVNPDYIGSGYGRMITQETISIGFNAHNLGKITLIVRKNNPIAQKLYEKIGFIMCGETKENIQGQNIDFFIMELDKKHFNTGEN